MNYATATPQSAALPIRVGAVTEIGQREENQDCMSGFSSPFGAVYLIADGMGGYRGGAEASQLVTDALSRHLLAAPASLPLPDALTLAVRLANVEVLEKGKSGNPEFAGMGSTIVIALLRQTAAGLQLTTAHIGDSRAYLFRQGELTLLTKDHTQVQWLLDNHAIDEASARSHPDASVLTRALGHTTELDVDISDAIPLQEGDRVMLCSDGLSGFATAEQIAATMGQNPDPNECASQLAQLALAAGSSDNITVQVLRVGATEPALDSMEERERELGPRRTGRGKWIRLLGFAAVLLVLGSGIGWFLHWRASSRQVADPALQKLAEDVKKLKTESIALNNAAQESRTSANEENSNLEKLGPRTGKSALLQRKQKELMDRMKKLDAEFGEIFKDSRDLTQAAINYDTHVQELQHPADQKPSADDRQKMLKDLKSNVPKSQHSLKEEQDKLGADQTDLKDAKAEGEKLTKEWNDTNHPAKPPDSKAGDKENGSKPNDSKAGDKDNSSKPNDSKPSDKGNNKDKPPAK